MQPPALEGYETICEPPHVFYVRREWKPFLIDQLRDSFASVSSESRTAHGDGRTPHFAYAPAGAPGRVLVRRAVRASAAAFLGDLYVSSSRFLREVQASHDAKEKGLDVPDVVAARLTRAGPFFYRYLLVVREVAGASNLLNLARTALPAVKRRVARELGSAVRQMHDRGVYHGDLTMKNILVSGLPSEAFQGNGANGGTAKEGHANGLKIHFIDFDGSRFEPRREGALAQANLDRLNRSVVKLFAPGGPITRTDKMRFLLSYAGGRDEARRLARACGRRLWMHRLWWWLTGAR